MTNNPVFYFFSTPGNAGPFFLRIAVASIFFNHGAQKALGWFGGAGWEQTIQTLTAHPGPGLPYVIAVLVIGGELAISLSLFLGFFTRLAGIGVLAIMSGALVLVIPTSTAFVDIEMPMLLWAAGLALFCLGGGAMSVDRTLSRNLLPLVG